VSDIVGGSGEWGKIGTVDVEGGATDDDSMRYHKATSNPQHIQTEQSEPLQKVLRDRFVR
jgi:hypothetical protein